ncbi:MAG: right-handed parallel beta-helix repeat-containing protein [Candidatus Limnocylindrus sp.]
MTKAASFAPLSLAATLAAALLLVPTPARASSSVVYLADGVVAGGGSCLSPDYNTGDYDEDNEALQAAIDEATESRNIREVFVCAGTYYFDDDVDIDEAAGDLTISGAGVDDTIFDGLGTTRFITAPESDIDLDSRTRLRLTVRNLTLLDGGNEGFGGAIWFNGTLRLIGVTATENEASSGGSVVDNNGGGQDRLIIQDSEFSNNETAGLGGEGGTILMNGGYVTVSRSTFTDNAMGQDNTKGAAIHGGWVVVSASDFDGNESAGDGGAIYASERLNVSGSTFTENVASAGHGGAIYIEDAAKSHISNSEFEGNSADEYGGAVFALWTDLDVTRSSFNNNASLSDDGGALGFTGLGTSGTLNIRSTTFTNNIAAVDGGALYLYDAARVTISSSTFGDPENDEAGNEAGENGGDIISATGFSPTYVSSLIIRNSDFHAASASDHGGSMALDCTRANLFNVTVADATGGADLDVTGDGGGIFVAGSSCTTPYRVSIANSRFLRNSSENQGGAIASSQGGETDDNAFDGFTISNTVFEENVADGGAAINVDGVRTLYIRNSDFIDNVAGEGGAIELCGPEVQIRASRFEGNEAATSAGAIQSSCAGGTLKVSYSTFLGNSSGSNFGALSLGTYATQLTNNVFRENVAGNSGGALGATIQDGESDLDYFGGWSGNIFKGNTAGLQAEHFWIIYEDLDEASSEDDLYRLLTRGVADIDPREDWILQE